MGGFKSGSGSAEGQLERAGSWPGLNPVTGAKKRVAEVSWDD
jgi:hypothetical protein